MVVSNWMYGWNVNVTLCNFCLRWDVEQDSCTCLLEVWRNNLIPMCEAGKRTINVIWSGHLYWKEKRVFNGPNSYECIDPWFIAWEPNPQITKQKTHHMQPNKLVSIYVKFVKVASWDSNYLISTRWGLQGCWASMNFKTFNVQQTQDVFCFLKYLACLIIISIFWSCKTWSNQYHEYIDIHGLSWIKCSLGYWYRIE